MRWIERLQRRVAITRQEAFVILLLSGLYLGGLAVRHFQHRAPRPPAAFSASSALQQFDSTSVASGPGADTAVPDTAQAPQGTAIGPPGRLDLNTATAAELETLPRIGPKLAERIIAYRSSRGAFRRVRDLTRVSGIGEKTLARLEPLVYVEER